MKKKFRKTLGLLGMVLGRGCLGGRVGECSLWGYREPEELRKGRKNLTHLISVIFASAGSLKLPIRGKPRLGRLRAYE